VCTEQGAGPDRFENGFTHERVTVPVRDKLAIVVVKHLFRILVFANLGFRVARREKCFGTVKENVRTVALTYPVVKDDQIRRDFEQRT
jgi:hypothetical protein